MKPIATQQEILLVTGTHFLSGQSFERGGKQDHLTEKEKLEEACWNGLLQEMLPELCEVPSNYKLFLWQIKEAISFIGIELCEYPEEKEKCLSIDPYAFLPERQLS